ncbi:hypothetical protein CBL_08410 [Carabus blaptoides fortunei]
MGVGIIVWLPFLGFSQAFLFFICNLQSFHLQPLRARSDGAESSADLQFLQADSGAEQLASERAPAEDGAAPADREQPQAPSGEKDGAAEGGGPVGGGASAGAGSGRRRGRGRGGGRERGGGDRGRVGGDGRGRGGTKNPKYTTMVGAR